MTTLSLASGKPSSLKADAVVIGIAQGPKGVLVAPGGEDVASALGKGFLGALASMGATGKAEEVTRLAALGDSLVIVGVDTAEGREWNVHVHVGDVGAAIEAGIEAGRPHRISFSPLAPVPAPAPDAGTRAAVAVVPSPGLAALFAGEGVRVITCGPEGVTEDDRNKWFAAARAILNTSL